MRTVFIVSFCLSILLFSASTPAQITVTHPNYLWEIWPRGWTITIRWTSDNTKYDRVTIEYSTDDQSSWKMIEDADCILNENEFDWTVPFNEEESDECWICVFLHKSDDDCSFVQGWDCNDAQFIIADAPTCYYSLDAFNVYCDPPLVPPDCIYDITYDITNNSSMRLPFCFGLSMRDPNFVEYDYHDCDICISLDPGETRSVTRCFCIPKWVMPGYWDARFSVWSIAFDSHKAGPRLCDSGWIDAVCLVPVKKHSWGQIKTMYKE